MKLEGQKEEKKELIETVMKDEGGNPRPSYDFGKPFSENNYMWSKSKLRLQKKRYVPKRFMTGLEGFDAVTRGLPYGLTILVGPAGCGKSLLAKTIANRHPTLYIIADSYADIPTGPHVQVADYLSFLPKWRKAIDEMFGLAKDTKVGMVVIDSITKFASSTTKAVEEADLRASLFAISKRAEGRLPIVCLSEVRGHGQWTYPAGGAAVSHAANMLINFGKVRCQAPWEARKYDAEVGDLVWTMYIQKDKHGLAKQGHEFKLAYNADMDWPELIPVVDKEWKKKEKEGEFMV